MDTTARKLIGNIKRRVPVAVKRPVRRLVPTRYRGLVDPGWHRRTIGNPSLWDALGSLQFEYLVEQGLAPHHAFLDVGCGPLRGGIHFIPYLDAGNYYGVDKNADVLEEVRRVELPAHGLVEKRPTLVAMEDFGFGRLGRRFDYALAQSVFTHLPLNSIIRCLMEIEQALVDGGRFYASFWENERGKFNLADIRQNPHAVTHFDRDFFHYDFPTFEWICEGTSLSVEYLGGWENPANQRMLLFRKAAAAPDQSDS
jgi:SAM-dependent methyltransferase